MRELYTEFIIRLERIYGPFNENRKSFKKASNSKIARELCYSDSQFSRLVNDSASEGEYERAIKNTERILNEQSLEKRLQESTSAVVSGIFASNKKWVMASGAFCIALLSVILFNIPGNDTGVPFDNGRDGMLKWIFETSAISPFTKLSDLPADCDFPCYKYQGQWNLKDSYKIPFFRERNGFHYVAKEVNLYSRCFPEDNENGKTMEGYEYQKHEIWYDKRELQIDSFLVNTDMTLTNDFYQNLDFEEDPNFVKLAYVHTFFRNEFNIDTTYISRKGSVIGRDVELVPNEELLEQLGSDMKVDDVKGEVNRIISNRLEDFSRPVSCKRSAVPDQDIHNISEKDEMSFECQLTTANAPIKYTKTYILNDQYIENICMTASR